MHTVAFKSTKLNDVFQCKLYIFSYAGWSCNISKVLSLVRPYGIPRLIISFTQISLAKGITQPNRYYMTVCILVYMDRFMFLLRQTCLPGYFQLSTFFVISHHSCFFATAQIQLKDTREIHGHLECIKRNENLYPTFLGSAKHPRTKLTRIKNVIIAFPFIAKFSDRAAKVQSRYGLLA